MKKNEKARAYIHEHWQDHTLTDLADACKLSKVTVFFLCNKLGVKPATVFQKKAFIIQSYKGNKTVVELSKILGCDISTVRRICRNYELPYKPLEFEKQAPAVNPVGRPRIVYVPPDPPKKPIQRPPAIYGNLSREERIDQILNR